MSSLDEWKKAATKVLGAGGLESLNRIREDGLVIKPLYTEADRPPLPHGGMPRPRDAFWDASWDASWQIAAMLEPAPDAPSLNAAMLEELEGGAGMLSFAPRQDSTMLADALDGVVPRAVRFEITGGDWHKAAEVILSEAVRGASTDTDHTGGMGGRHILPGRAAEAEAIAAWLMAEERPGLKPLTPGLKPLTIAGDKAHEAGHTDTGEMALMLAELAHVLRVFAGAGIPPGEALSRVHLRFAVGASLYGGLAKTRAMRQIFSHLAASCGADPAPVIADLHGVTAPRHLARLDPDTNMLRNATALLAMVLGGVGVATILPHDWLTGSGAASRRLARNSHHIMAAEARLDQVSDPAAGAFYIERLTHDLATEAWRKFQQIESEGGVMAAQALAESWAAEAHAARQQAVDEGREILLGVTQHPPPLTQKAGGLLPVIDARGGAYRPAAPWEALYTAHRGRHPRVLCLDIGEATTAAEAARWLRLAGVEPTITRCGDKTAAAATIAAAEPQLILLGGVGGIDEVAAQVLKLIGDKAANMRFCDAASLNEGGNKRTALESILGGG